MTIREKTPPSAPDLRYSFNEIMNTTSAKIQNILLVKGCMSVQRLIKLVHEKDDIVYRTLSRLADEGKISSVMKGKTEYVTLVVRK